ncbi:MAG: TlpA family protein disulfide reductase [bacterium]|nr:TlpA family protein disulfide reductase [bacterium]
MKSIIRKLASPLFVAGIVSVILLAGCGGGGDQGDVALRGAEATEASVKSSGAVDNPPDKAADGKLAPPFKLKGLDGKDVQLADFEGEVRLVDFWATWCAPCREEVPMFNELHEKYGDQGFRILAIADMEESAEAVQDFIKEHEIEYMNLLGSEEVTTTYRVYGLPTAYLIDREGRVVKFFFGPKPHGVLEGKIRELLGLPAQETA